MAAKIQLVIDSEAHIQGIEKAQQGLKDLGAAGKTLNQTLKTNDLDAMRLALERNYHTTANFNGEIAASNTYLSDLRKTAGYVTQTLGKGEKLSFIDANGIKQEAATFTEAMDSFVPLTNKITGEVENVQKSMSKLSESGAYFPKDFQSKLEKSATAATLFGTEIDGIAVKMAKIKEQGTILSLAGGDKEQIKALSDEYQRLSKEHATLSNAANGTGTRIKNLIKNFVSAQLIVYALRMAVSAFTGTIKDASQAAAELEQIEGRFQAVYDGISRADEAVDNLVKNFGLAASTGKNVVSQIGDIMMGLGMSQSAAAEFAEVNSAFIQDLIAQKDLAGEVEDITSSIMSGYAGNNQNFRRMGSIIKESAVEARLYAKGMQDVTGEQLELQKVIARQEIFMEQQKNAIGAVKREWDTLLSVNRRYEQESKTLKEHLGKEINAFWLPLKNWQTEVIAGWNDMNEARDNYQKGKYEPENFDQNGAMAERLKKDLRQAFSADINLESQTFQFGKYTTMDMEDVQKWARQYGATYSFVAQAAKEAGYEVSDSLMLQAKALESVLAGEREAAKILRKEREDLKAWNAERAQDVKDLNDMFLNLGTDAFIGRDASEFAGFDINKILGVDTAESDLKAKFESLKKMAETLFNNVKAEDNPITKMEWEEALAKVTAGLKNVNKELLSITYDEKLKSMGIDISDLEERNRLTEMYGEDNADIVNLKMEQVKVEREAWEFMQKQIDSGMDATEAEKQRAAYAELIANYYGTQLDTLKKQASVTARMALDAKSLELHWAQLVREMAKAQGVDVANEVLAAQIDYLKQLADANKELAETYGLLKDGVALGRGNIDLNNRPVVNNPDGSRSTVLSSTVGFDDYYAVIPQVIHGALVSMDEAIGHYLTSGEHLGIFQIIQKQGETWEEASARALKEANEYAQTVHEFEEAKLSMADVLKGLLDATLGNIRDAAAKNAWNTISDARGEFARLGASDDETAELDRLAKLAEFNAGLVEAGATESQINGLMRDYGEILDAIIRKTKDLAAAEKEREAIKKSSEAFDTMKNAVLTGQEEINALRTSNALIGKSDYQKAKAELEEAVYSFSLALLKGGVTTDKVFAMAADYRLLKEKELADTYLESRKKEMEAIFDSLGDVGTVRKMYDDYQDDMDFGGADLAGTNLLIAILAEVASHFETFDEALSIVSTALDAIAPMVNQFLAPLLIVLEPIVSILNVLRPLLTMLFPVIQTVATVFVALATVVNWFSRVIEYAAGKITFWTSSDNVSWDYVNAAWKEGADQIEKIWALEIDARAEYLAELTDAQKGELDAYKKLYEGGVLNELEYQAQVGGVYGKNYDNVDVASLKSSNNDYSTNTTTINLYATADTDLDALAQKITALQAKNSRRNTA